MFCGLWTTLYYGPQAMPDLWVAFSSLAAVGLFLQAAGPGARAKAADRTEEVTSVTGATSSGIPRARAGSKYAAGAWRLTWLM